MPSTGKLYHHKMRLRNLTAESNVDEVMDYLEKRHPLYFMNKKFQKAQVRDLVQRVKYRLIAKNKVAGASQTSKAVGLKELSKSIATEKENEQKPAFKSGSQLPTLSEKLPQV